MFRVRAKKLKEKLMSKAEEVKKHLMEAVDLWSMEQVRKIHSTNQSIEDRIGQMPQSEKELVDLRAFIKQTKDVTSPELAALLKDVENHYVMLDTFSFFYKEEDIEALMLQKTWPSKIEMAIGLSKEQIEAQEEMMKGKLETEQGVFAKDMLEYEK